MTRKKLKKTIFDSNVFWIAVSLIASLAIWIYVVSTENSDVTQIFRGVRVELVGEESLQNSRNLIVTDLDTSSVRVELRGPRRIVNALDSDDLIAQVDVSKLTRSAYASMKYKIVYPDGVDTRNISEVSYSPDTVTFVVSNLNTVTIPVRGRFEGTLSDGYTAESPKFEPSTITVTGPDAYLKDVSYAWVSFGTDAVVATSYSEDAAFTLMNADGNPVSTTYLSTSENVVTATLPILEMKEVPLAVDLIEGSGATTANTVVTITPSSIKLAGDSAILDGINRILLSTIDLTDFKTSFSETYTIPFDNSLRNLSGVTEARVDVEIVGLTTSVFTIKNLALMNIPEELDAEIITESLEVTIRGTEEQLAQISAENIRAVADLSDYQSSTGTYLAPVRIYVDGSVGTGAVGDYTIPVSITNT